jgi:hypothetical protein
MRVPEKLRKDIARPRQPDFSPPLTRSSSSAKHQLKSNFGSVPHQRGVFILTIGYLALKLRATKWLAARSGKTLVVMTFIFTSAAGALAQPTSLGSLPRLPGGILQVGDILGNRYYDSFRQVICSNQGYCQVTFETVPSQFLLHATNINCIVKIDGLNNGGEFIQLSFLQGTRSSGINKSSFFTPRLGQAGLLLPTP